MYYCAWPGLIQGIVKYFLGRVGAGAEGTLSEQALAGKKSGPPGEERRPEEMDKGLDYLAYCMEALRLSSQSSTISSNSASPLSTGTLSMPAWG